MTSSKVINTTVRILVGAKPVMRAVALLFALYLNTTSAAEETVRVGSKVFTENFILGEMIAQIIEQTGEVSVERKMGLGSEAILYQALTNGAIDIYPEYTGTLKLALLKDPDATDIDKLRARLAGSGLTISNSIGFNNTSALAVTETLAETLGLRTISDLRQHPELTAAFGAGYLDRPDGWPGIKQHYDLQLADTLIMDHALKYNAISNGEIDLIDIYSTDGKLQKFDIHVLQDDKGFFPDYSAILFVRQDFIDRFPRSWQRLNELLVGAIDDDHMSRLNALADLEGKSPAEISARFLNPDVVQGPQKSRLQQDIFKHTIDHLILVLVSVSFAILVGIPLGVMAARVKTLGRAALLSVEVVQTIPSLALLVFMIPLFGIGQTPALVVLFLYALLPIVRNTYTGMIGLDRQLLEMAAVLGLSNRQTLFRVELPLASLSILSGVKTSAVVTVGTATLAAFIGGGGYGTLIIRGLALNDNTLILAGAIPAAIMAIVIHAGFELLDRVIIPLGLRKNFVIRS